MESSVVRSLVIGMGALLVLPALCAVLPEVAERLRNAASLVWSCVGPVFRASGLLFTQEGRLDRAQAASQAGGACLFMIPGALVFGICCYVVTVTTLVPLFGLESSSLPIERMEELIGLSIVLLGAVSFMACTDLLGVTYTTHFAETERARFFLLVCMASFFVAAVAIGAGVAWYRGEVMTMLDPLAESTGSSISDLVKLLVIALDILLVIGTGIGLTSLDRFFAVVAGTATAAAGLLLATFALLLNGLEFFASLLSSFVASVRHTLSPSVDVANGIARGVGSAASSLGHGVQAAVANLVRKASHDTTPLDGTTRKARLSS